jgi:hypothetical protein
MSEILRYGSRKVLFRFGGERSEEKGEID